MFVHAKSHSLLVQAPNPGLLASMVPTIQVDGPGFNVAVRHNEATTVKLRELGMPAPSPIVAYYNWPKYKGIHEPFAHQKLMAEFMTMHRKSFNLCEMGTGKTSATLWALDYLMRTKQCRRALVACPLSNMEQTWLIGATETVMHRRAVMVYGDRAQRLKQLSEPADIYIINHDGLKITPIRDAIRRRPDIDQIVVDEGGNFRKSNTDKYKALQAILSRPGLGLWWLTGTPCPKAPTDAWAQVRLVNPNNVPRFFGTFRSQTMVEVSEHKWVPKKGHEDIVFAAMQPAIRFLKKDCLDLPPMLIEDRACEMSVEQKKAYKQMSEAMQIADKALAAVGGTITAVNAADRVNKLRQIMLGSIKSGPDTYTTYDYHSRLAVCLEAIEEASAKAIVIVPFKGITQDLAGKIARHHSVAVINGDVGVSKRNKIFSDFKNEAEPHVLICHPAVMSHGLNLTEADFLIFFGPIYSNDQYRQVIERINRPPQTKKMTVVRIGCNAMEWQIYKSLDRDEDQQQLILGLYKSVMEGRA